MEYVLGATGAVLAYLALAWVFPALLRPFFWLVANTLYRFRVYGRDHIPATGGVLVVCNHVSYVDWLVLWMASPRPVTFVLWAGHYQNPMLRLCLSWARNNALCITDGIRRPRAVVESLQKIADALDAGKLVVIFPEGALTRSGHMLPFGRGIEMILKRAKSDVAVVPACTDGLWGSVFSFHGGRLFWKWPRAFRPPVGVLFGEAIPKTLTAPEIRLAVQEATADAAVRQSDFVPAVHRSFVRNAAKFRNLFRTCVVDNAAGEKILTWGKMFVAAMCVTSYLRPRVANAQNVGVWLPTGLGSALANLAIAILGKTSVNLNYTAGTDAVRSAVRQANIRAVVTSKRFLMRAFLDLPDDIERVYLEDVLAAAGGLQKLRYLLMAILLPGWVIDRLVLGLHRHKHDDPLTIVFSSGSTGEPKGIVLTHRNIAANVESFVRTVHIVRTDVLYGVLPFFHSFGYTVCLWAPLVAEPVALWYPDPRSAKEVGQIAKKFGATIFLGTATFLRFYLRRCEADDFRTVKLLVCGAEKLPVKLQEEFKAKFGILPLEGYGCTELSPVASVNLHDVTADGITQKCNTPGTVGQPVIGVCIKAFTPDDERRPLTIGEEGVLCAKGANVMAGYLGKPEKTKEAVRDGWYNTGDVGHVEPDGFVRITGRLSRFAKIAGEMVPLERLEDEMHDALGAGGDRLLAVAAVADERRGERLVVLHLPDVKDRLPGLFDALPGRGIPNLWVPDTRDCYPIEAMPVLGSGKLDLKKLGDLAKELAQRA